MRHKTTISVLVCVLGAVGFAADMRLPDKAVAGQSVAIGTSGSGEATLYVVGPGTAIKRQIKLGDDVQLKGEELRKSCTSHPPQPRRSTFSRVLPAFPWDSPR